MEGGLLHIYGRTEKRMSTRAAGLLKRDPQDKGAQEETDEDYPEGLKLTLARSLFGGDLVNKWKAYKKDNKDIKNSKDKEPVAKASEKALLEMKALLAELRA